MGASPSTPEQRKLQEIQDQMKQMQLEAKRVAEQNELRSTQENMKMQEEIRRVQEESQKLQGKQMEEMQREAKRVVEENELRSTQENMKMQEEIRRVQEESQKLQGKQMEEMQREAKRVAEENELRRTREALRQTQENMRMQEEIRKVQEESQKLQEKIKKEEERRKMNELARRIEEEARIRVEKEVWLRKEAERNLEKGIPPVRYPTGDDIRVVRERLQYQEGGLHIAITGVSGSGKSSLINAFRGYSIKHPDAAKTGTSETTEAIGRFCDLARPWMFWYDVPGAGTPKVPDWQYFNDQGLFIFDILIIAVDIRFTRIDAALLFNCSRFGIPTFIVRSKADQHIENIMKEDRESDESGDEGGGDDNNSPQNTEKKCIMVRNKFIKDTRQEYAAIFTKAGLPPQKVYIVSRDSIRSMARGSKNTVRLIDEMELIRDILYAANERRRQDQSQSQSA